MSIEKLRTSFFPFLLFFVGFAMSFAVPALGQQEIERPVIVQPGAPGEASRILPSETRAVLPEPSTKDVEFMQGMIMHHAQAVEMTDMIAERTDNRDVQLLGARIRQSQADEMEFMTRWLKLRGESTEHKMPGEHNAHAGHGGHAGHQMLMPGMLTPHQMKELERAKGTEFDRLFLAGMIQHHEGALVMVKELFTVSGAGQDAELFNFATDVDTGQRVEIRSMQMLLERMARK